MRENTDQRNSEYGHLLRSDYKVIFTARTLQIGNFIKSTSKFNSLISDKQIYGQSQLESKVRNLFELAIKRLY